ncbi:MAG: hypothetical protein ACTSWN_05680 [Promethearchaeota archaeon]
MMIWFWLSGMCAYSFSKQPKIGFILPFKAMRLTTFDTAAGIPLFTHDWAPANTMSDVNLYASMLQGVSLIVKESLKKGNVTAIQMEHALLIVERSTEYEVAFAFVASRASQILHDGLKLFAEKFIIQFKEDLANPHEVSQFESVKSLIDECFPFVPEYTQSNNVPIND